MEDVTSRVNLSKFVELSFPPFHSLRFRESSSPLQSGLYTGSAKVPPESVKSTAPEIIEKIIPDKPRTSSLYFISPPYLELLSPLTCRGAIKHCSSILPLRLLFNRFHLGGRKDIQRLPPHKSIPHGASPPTPLLRFCLLARKTLILSDGALGMWLSGTAGTFPLPFFFPSDGRPPLSRWR